MLILKFSPYFPPHKWWLESHIQERSKRRHKKWYWEVINITTPMWQEDLINKNNEIIYKWQTIWYKTTQYEIITLDAFDLIPVFPFPKFRSKKFRITIKYLKQKIKSYNKKDIVVNTHTRFFLTSLVWGIFAKCNWLKWIHIEHGVDFVKLASKFKTKIAWLYDQTIGRYVFRCSNIVIGISWWCQRFANKFTKKEIPVIHRGIDFETKNFSKNNKSNTVNLWFVGRLVKLKWIDLLINAFYAIQKHTPNLKLEILWDWDEKERLQTMVKSINMQNKIKFLWFKDKNYIANNFLPNTNIIVNPSYQEWLPTSVLEWLLAKCVVVATNVWWTPEISKEKDLILVNPWDKNKLQKGLEDAIKNHAKLKWLSYNSVKNHFDWNKNIEKYYNVYKKTLNNEKK